LFLAVGASTCLACNLSSENQSCPLLQNPNLYVPSEVDLWAAISSQAEDKINKFDGDDDGLNVFEESLENVEDEKNVNFVH
jgi:hypothetical protein